MYHKAVKAVNDLENISNKTKISLSLPLYLLDLGDCVYFDGSVDVLFT